MMFLKILIKFQNKRAKTALEKDGEAAHLSKELVTIVTDLDLGHDVESLKYTMESNEELLEYLDELNFRTLKAKISAGAGNSVTSTKPRAFIDYEVIKEKDKYQDILELIKNEDQVYMEPFFTHDDYHQLDPIVFGVATGTKNYIFYTDDFSFSDFVVSLANYPNLLMISSNVKTLYFCLFEKQIDTHIDVFDITQAHFVYDPEKKHNLQTMALEFIQENIPVLKDLRKENFEDIQSQKNFEFGFAKRLYSGIRIYPWVKKRIEENETRALYDDLDAPLMPILARMEWLGVNLDTKYYGKLETEFTKITSEILAKVTEISGEEVNLKSPKQVGKLLFEDLGLPIIKKQKLVLQPTPQYLKHLMVWGRVRYQV